MNRENDDVVEHLAYIRSNGTTTVVSKSASESSALHTKMKVFDQYGKLIYESKAREYNNELGTTSNAISLATL